eukprot:scaffold200191_cov22-Tisochrysis_lutea.AAC.5
MGKVHIGLQQGGLDSISARPAHVPTPSQWEVEWRSTLTACLAARPDLPFGSPAWVDNTHIIHAHFCKHFRMGGVGQPNLPRALLITAH